MTAAAMLRGQTEATGYLYMIEIMCPVGDELHDAITNITSPLDPGADARLRGFARSIQKVLEADRQPRVTLTADPVRPDRRA